MRHCLLRASICFLILGIFSVAVFATPDAKEIDIDYDRLVRSLAGRPSISQPAAGAPPRALVVVEPNEESQQVERSAAANGLETRAAVAATWAARQQIKIFGRREIYQAGFYDGLKQAFHDPLIGDWDFRQGHRAGRRDLDAYRIGSELGLEHARLRAGEDAYARLTAQSHDLDNEPRPRARPAAADRKTSASTPIPAVRKPRLLDVFEDLPLSSVLEHGELKPLPDAFKLYRCDSYDDFYDRRWADSTRAFDYWLDHHRDRAFWRQLDGDDRARFAKIFRSTFSRQLPDLSAGAGESAYARGQGDGWSYGVLVVQEWRYREGFHEGFTSALREHARSTFHDRYPSLCDDRYGELWGQELMRPRGP